MFARKKKSSADYGFLSHSRRKNRFAELLDSELFRTLFAVFLAAGSIVYCAVALPFHFVWLDIYTGIPIALALATVGNVLLTVKCEYLYDEDDGIGKNILALLVVILYHILFTLATLTSFLVFNYSAQAESAVSPFAAALNLPFGVIAIAQPFIYGGLESKDKEGLTVFGFIFFYAALYLINVGICCLETYVMVSHDMIVSRIVAGVAGGATVVLAIIRIIICIKNIVVSTGRAVVDKLTPQSVKEHRQMEADFIRREHKEHPQFFKCAKRLKRKFFDAPKELIKTSVDVTVVTNAYDSYGSDYNDLKVTVTASITRHLPSYLSPSRKKELRQEYSEKLLQYLASLVPDIKAETGYTGNVSFDLTVK